MKPHSMQIRVALRWTLTTEENPRGPDCVRVRAGFRYQVNSFRGAEVGDVGIHDSIVVVPRNRSADRGTCKALPFCHHFLDGIPCAAHTTHYVSEFRKILQQVIDGEPYNGSQRALARALGITHSHLSRVMSGEREFSPKVVGLVTRTLSAAQADKLIRAYLSEVAEEIADAARRGPEKK